ncbi:MAG: hypothetical protein R3E79_31635 [Caldilineaceae bacterium]
MLTALPHNPVVAEAFFYVQNMLKPPTSLLTPSILWQVWRTPNLRSAPTIAAPAVAPTLEAVAAKQ